MKFFTFAGLALIGSLIDWLCYFGVLFLYDLATHRVAAIGFNSSNSDLAASIILPVIINIAVMIISIIITTEG